MSSASIPISEKVAYVLSQSQTRDHDCHWPGCGSQVPPAKWGCTKHWKMLPSDLRNRVWRAYRPGQEVNASPSESYIAVARAIQDWILENHPPKKKEPPIPNPQGSLF